ncbi:plasmid pRiA4b ORF-3 family protein [Streptosporangium amethystogenes]|uniref:plasmid pRiA4b ORF-3 family protein n=1 Tax=Streptosporangium amethystogenes TaxID=2002 RepID=UPI000A002816
MGTIHQVKVTLREVSPPVWRRVHVPSTVTLADLHEVIQVAMGWEQHHLHVFSDGDRQHGDNARDEWNSLSPDLHHSALKVSTHRGEGPAACCARICCQWRWASLAAGGDGARYERHRLSAWPGRRYAEVYGRYGT